jgi:DNA-directed RNA polymerase subunit RPC12/RpoP
MTLLEEKIKKESVVGFRVYSCGECGVEVLVPQGKLPKRIECECGKDMELNDVIVLDIEKIWRV